MLRAFFSPYVNYGEEFAIGEPDLCPAVMRVLLYSYKIGSRAQDQVDDPVTGFAASCVVIADVPDEIVPALLEIDGVYEVPL